MQNDISILIARRLLNVATTLENEVLSEWISKSSENQSFVKMMEKYWRNNPEKLQDVEIQMSRKRLLVRLDASSKGYRKRTILFYLSRIASVIVVVVTIAGLSVYLAHQSSLFFSDNHVEIYTEIGKQSKVLLPDGSSVWLNADTKVHYSEEFNKRTVSLIGEAYFEVSHALNRPFYVEIGKARIKVLGTKFNVSHYDDSRTSEVSLLSGRISMELPEMKKNIILQPGEKIVYNSTENLYTKKPINIKQGILWRQGILEFKNETFEGLLKKLERYYAVKFIYEKEAFNNIHYTGTFDNLSINSVLDFINLTIPLEYEIEKDTIILSSINMKMKTN